MGAGENALFEIFSTLYDCGEGALLVIDEVELGLHAEAQRRFVDRLKEACLEINAQVICTTHSKEIFDRLPDDARYFVETVNGYTRVIPSISSDFAFSKMGGVVGKELDVFVEDDVAKALLVAALPALIRTRVAITVIGSANCISRQLAATYLKAKTPPVLAVFDGDQRTKELANLSHARNMAEKVNDDFDNWAKERMAYLPGETWPEMWLMQKGHEIAEEIARAAGSDADSVVEALEQGMQAGKHHELYVAGKLLGLEREYFLQLVSAELARCSPEHFVELVRRVSVALGLVIDEKTVELI